MQTPHSLETLRFGDYELDLAAYELRRRGRTVKLGRQPMDLLILLVERRRQLVTRAEIVDRLWGRDVFVDVETGVNTAISKVRQALRDSAEAPTFVETVPGRGYRFVASVEPIARASDPRSAGAWNPGPAESVLREPPPASASPPDIPVPSLQEGPVTQAASGTELSASGSSSQASPGSACSSDAPSNSSASSGRSDPPSISSASSGGTDRRSVSSASSDRSDAPSSSSGWSDGPSGPSTLVTDVAGGAEGPAPQRPAASVNRLGPPRQHGQILRVAIGLVAIVMTVGTIGWMWREGDEPALAVLPFENLGADDYVAAGLTDETSAWLAQVGPERLRVKGRTSGYKQSTKTVAEIGRELAVDYLVQGSIRAEGGRLRVTATLIRVQDQQHVWSHTYNREPASLLGLQEELSTAIAEQIKFRLAPERLSLLELRQSQNYEARDAYFRARHEVRRRNPDGNRRGIEEFKRAIGIDPDYALAWSELAFTYAASTVNGDAPPALVGPLARSAAQQALRSNANLSEAQLAVGYEQWLMERDWKSAEASLRLAIHLDGSNSAAHRVLGHALSQWGRHEEAAVAMRDSRDLDALDPLNIALSSQVAFQARDAREALEFARRAVSIDPGLWIGYVQLAQAYAFTGESDLALEALADATRFSGGNSKSVSLRGYVLANMGRASEAREVLRALEATSRNRYVPGYAMALVHAGLNEPDAMFTRLEQALRDGDVHLMYLPVDQKWDPYRTDPRFVDLLARWALPTFP